MKLKNPLTRFFKRRKTKKLKNKDLFVALMTTRFDLYLLTAKVAYIMANPTNFLNIALYHDLFGEYQHWFPKEACTASKIVIIIQDNRDIFSSLSGQPLLDEFGKLLPYIYEFIKRTSMPNCLGIEGGVVGSLLDKKGKTLAYYYGGKYVMAK